jgi:hypothetical protein
MTKVWAGSAAAALAALVVALPAGAEQSYTDSAGETPGAADIGTVTVSNSAAPDTITFAVATDMPTFEANAAIGILMDTDQNPNTGGDGGFDSAIIASSTGTYLYFWVGTGFVPTGAAAATYTNGVLTVSVLASDLISLDVASEPKVFSFGVVTARGPDASNPIADHAPDNGLWSYTLNPPPTVETPTAPLPSAKPKPVIGQVSSVAVSATPAPKAGKRFTAGLRVSLSTGTTVKATKVKCTARLAGKVFKGEGTGSCTFRLPTAAAGKRIVVKATGKYRSAPVTATKTFRVG